MPTVNESFMVGTGIYDDENPVLYTVRPTGPGFEPLIDLNLPDITVNEAKVDPKWFIIVGAVILALLFFND